MNPIIVRYNEISSPVAPAGSRTSVSERSANRVYGKPVLANISRRGIAAKCGTSFTIN
jgi:hypothetical protein